MTDVIPNKNTLIIAPNAGFGNRLRTMVSAIYLSEKLNMKLEHLWIGTKYRCAYSHIQNIHDKSFEYFFKESVPRCDYKDMRNKVNKVYTEWMPEARPNAWYHFQSYGQKLLQTSVLLDLKLVNETMDNSENFLIETSYINLNISKEDKARIYSQYFIANDQFLSRINILEKDTIGISIRMRDFLKYFPESKFDETKIIKWLKTFEQPVLLFSDDVSYAKKMRQQLNNPVIPMFENDLDTNNDNSFLEFLMLSKCSRLYGTELSSFCEEAANYGNIDYTPLNKDFFTCVN